MSTNIQTVIEQIQYRIDQNNAATTRLFNLSQVLSKFPQLDDLSIPISFQYDGHSIDFDYLTHDQTIEVIKVLGGKWTKSLNGTDTIDYNTTIDGVNFRIFAGQPPPSCEVIEETVIVPSHYTPETTKTIRRLKCVPEISGPVSN